MGFTEAGIGGSLYDAKLSVPAHQRSGTVSRRSLIDAARASDCRVVSVTAPAGYGKSTLLAEWARSEDRSVGWVSLDRFDDDPAALMALLASAYARISSGDVDLVADMGGLGTSVLGRSAPRLASAIAASPDPFVLMLDDLHEVQSPDCHDALGVVVAGIPRGSQLVAASRSEQPHLPRLRVAGDALEFGPDDLALDAAGAQQVFLQEELELTPEAATVLTEHTEGWPVGLYLAALIAKEQPQAAVDVTGDDRYVADYLYREALLQQPEDVRRFLLRTAVLDQLTAPLCDAVLDDDRAHLHLRYLETTNLFLVPLDRRREWYRYHALFREFLLGELRRTEPETMEKLHLRAADWYEANGSPALAVEHLLHTRERRRCVQLVTMLILPTYNAGQMSKVQRWLAALDDVDIEQYPPLAVLSAWVSALTGRTTDALRWAAIVDAASFDAVPLDGTASFESARSMLRAVMCADGTEQMLQHATFAVDAEPAWSPWRDTALVLLAEAGLLAGDVDGAEARFAETLAAGSALGNSDTVVMSETNLALLEMDRGHWAEATERIAHALAVVDEFRMYDYAVSALAFAAASRLALHQGDATETNRELTRAMRVRPTCTFVLPWMAVRARLQLARVSVAMADATTARHLLLEIDDLLLACPALGTLVDEVTEFRSVVASTAAGGAAHVSPLSPAELRVLPYLQTHLTFPEIASRLFVSHNTVRSQVGSIYRKLGVSSRTLAVEHATAIGLLGA